MLEFVTVHLSLEVFRKIRAAPIGLHLRKFLGIVILAQEGSPPLGWGVGHRSVFRKSEDFGENPVKVPSARFCHGPRLYNNNKRVRMITNLSPDCNDHNVCQWKQKKLNRESFVNRIAEPVIRFHPGIIADSFMTSHP